MVKSRVQKFAARRAREARDCRVFYSVHSNEVNGTHGNEVKGAHGNKVKGANSVFRLFGSFTSRIHAACNSCWLFKPLAVVRSAPSRSAPSKLASERSQSL